MEQTDFQSITDNDLETTLGGTTVEVAPTNMSTCFRYAGALSERGFGLKAVGTPDGLGFIDHKGKQLGGATFARNLDSYDGSMHDNGTCTIQLPDQKPQWPGK